MKRLIYIFLAGLMIFPAIVSCKKDNAGKKIPKPKAVDIGLVITREDGTQYKLLWANFNIGAAKEWEVGNYYAFGETEPKSEYTWENYKWANGSSKKLTKYGEREEYWDMEACPDGPDHLGTLLPSDDVAHKKLGGDWRMPTYKEIDALNKLEKDKTNYVFNWELALDADGNEIYVNGELVYGLRITWKETGNSIFLPASGEFDKNEIKLVKTGRYGTSSVVDDSNYLYLFFSGTFSDYNTLTDRYSTDRYVGLPVRAVCAQEL